MDQDHSLTAVWVEWNRTLLQPLIMVSVVSINTCDRPQVTFKEIRHVGLWQSSPGECGKIHLKFNIYIWVHRTKHFRRPGRWGAAAEGWRGGGGGGVTGSGSWTCLYYFFSFTVCHLLHVSVNSHLSEIFLPLFYDCSLLSKSNRRLWLNTWRGNWRRSTWKWRRR